MANFRTTAVIIALGVLAVIGISWHAIARTSRRYSAQSGISIAQARHIAEKQVMGGKIINAMLEKEKGGSGMRYSFDIRHEGTVHEVGIDARTGKVLENKVESKEANGRKRG